MYIIFPFSTKKRITVNISGIDIITLFISSMATIQLYYSTSHNSYMRITMLDRPELHGYDILKRLTVVCVLSTP